ncbi:MAG: class E sortase [Patescibacteria group bacterium]|jgi:sortase A
MKKEINLSEEDLVRLFAGAKRKKADLIVSLALFAGKALFVFALILAGYTVINFPAIKDKVAFWYLNDIKTAEVIVDQPGVGIIKTEDIAPTDVMPDMANNTIRIPALSIEAPISWRVENTPALVAKGLANGVIQLDGTSLPGEKGNIYVTGHSSNYVWAKGNYNSIFAIIDKLLPGDLIYIKYNDTVFTYKTLDQKVVTANDLSVLSQTEDSRLTLVTCWPVGTSYKRMVVTASQSSPSPENNIAPANKPSFSTLPGAR